MEKKMETTGITGIIGLQDLELFRVLGFEGSRVSGF